MSGNAASKVGGDARDRDEVVTYQFRPSLMNAPQEFVLERDALVWTIGRRTGRILYTEIRKVRLSYRPVTMQMHRFQIEIWSQTAPKLIIASASWRSIVEQERQDAPYRAFVAALHARLAESGAQPILQAGAPPFAFWPGAALFAAMVVTLPWIVVRAASTNMTWGTALVALVIGVFLWQIGAFFWRNWPQHYSVNAIPEAVLPTG